MNHRIAFVALLAVAGAGAQAQYLFQGVQYLKYTGLNNHEDVDMYPNRTITGGTYTPGAKKDTAAGEIRMLAKATSASPDAGGITRTTFCLSPDATLKSAYFAKFIGKAFVSDDFKFDPANVPSFTSYAGNILRDSGLGGNTTVAGKTFKRSARTQFALWNDAGRDSSYFTRNGVVMSATSSPHSAADAEVYTSDVLGAKGGFRAVDFVFYVPLKSYNPSVGLADVNGDQMINHLDITADSGNQILVSSEPVPEPMTLGLAAAGLLSAARRRRARRA